LSEFKLHLGKIKFLHPEKHSISYGYEHNYDHSKPKTTVLESTKASYFSRQCSWNYCAGM